MIVPSIDLQDSQAVQLIGGETKALDAGDPRPIARRYGRVGEIAVVDLDAALGRGSNAAVIEELQTLGIPPGKTVWIPNGVELPDPCALDPEAKRRFRERLRLDQAQQVLVFSGRLSAEKGLFEILTAWEKISKKFPRAKLFILGEGGAQRSVEKDLKQRVSEKNLKDSVEFTGRVDSVLPYLIAAGPAVVSGMLRAAIPRDRPPAWFTALSHRVRSLLPR